MLYMTNLTKRNGLIGNFPSEHMVLVNIVAPISTLNTYAISHIASKNKTALH